MLFNAKQAFLVVALIQGSNALAFRLPASSHGLAVRDQAAGGTVPQLATLKAREDGDDDDDDEEAAPGTYQSRCFLDLTLMTRFHKLVLPI